MMPMMVKRFVSSTILALALFAAACGGASDGPQQPAPALDQSAAIDENDAVDKAKVAATEQGYSTDGLRVNPAQIFGEWHVSFEPIDSDTLKGGYLVVLDAVTGELLDLIEYV